MKPPETKIYEKQNHRRSSFYFVPFHRETGYYSRMFDAERETMLIPVHMQWKTLSQINNVIVNVMLLLLLTIKQIILNSDWSIQNSRQG